MALKRHGQKNKENDWKGGGYQKKRSFLLREKERNLSGRGGASEGRQYRQVSTRGAFVYLSTIVAREEASLATKDHFTFTLKVISKNDSK